MNERPLCPHCYRSGCPWLVSYISGTVHWTEGSIYPHPGSPPADTCPLWDEPLAPNVRRRLAAELNTR